MGTESTTITFRDDSGGDGVIIIRRFNKQVAVAISLEHDGDIEVVLAQDVVQSVIQALKDAVE